MTFFGTFLRSAGTAAMAALVLAPLPARAGAQVEEQLAPSVVTVLSQSISDRPVPTDYVNRGELQTWLHEMSQRLATKIGDVRAREDFLGAVHYEATRAGLDPQLVLGVIQYESAFRKYAISTAGARGYMQVMPFWVKLIGQPSHNLFHLRTNLAYGCAILRLYLDVEKGDYFRALGRYNGSLGQPDYPNLVLTAWRGRWKYDGPIG